jgi:dTDP-4-amino-4,6-dideoxygalactose transaminase
VVSLHATKIFGIGEGGCVLCTDRALADEIRNRTNFGFVGGRLSQTPALNAKMSEYHAAVGLAALDRWPETRARHAKVSAGYVSALAGLSAVELLSGYGRAWLANTCDVKLPAGRADQILLALRARGIDSRQWWEKGCHRHPAFEHCPRLPLEVTDDLAGRVLGLPYFFDMAADQVALVVESLRADLAASGEARAGLFETHRRSARAELEPR